MLEILSYAGQVVVGFGVILMFAGRFMQRLPVKPNRTAVPDVKPEDPAP
ncbi:hypothetical protein IV500_04190 [Paeniglutamicibacter antarcticus]|uniref:Uncharacterized protein n=1 Tax=Arthrobacter terrae TaxID=2935737 RepID=A0A931CLZ7_9MICC|nr:hypothetical protein [Arthrobacter terrae]MBG0738620.1 hypothetical protein [Arthrobacter terrae]